MAAIQVLSGNGTVDEAKERYQDWMRKDRFEDVEGMSGGDNEESAESGDDGEDFLPTGDSPKDGRPGGGGPYW
jgi:hypothetical protein